MTWIEIVKSILSLLPAIIAALKAIEEVLPESGSGSQKLALVRDVVTGINEEATTLWPYIEKTIAKIVTFFNAVGIFKTTKTEVPK